MSNIITSKFCSGSTQTWTDEAYQWDYGQVLQFDGLELPDAYEVHFSNTPLTGTTITQIGGDDGVTVPDQFFQSGETIYAWVYLHEGEDDGETVYMVTIPVKKRPQPSDDVPSPVEQSAIDQAIAALNIAVEKAEDAIEHYPTIIDGTWHLWDVTAEEYVDRGVQAQGEQGDPGDPGADGFSPEISVTDIAGGHRVTITDAEGTQSFDVLDGSGAPAFYGVCNSSYGSLTKVVTCDGFELVEGARIIVTFTASSDTGITTGQLKLNVNSTGAKNIKYRNSITTFYSYSDRFCDYKTCEFVYDGTYYIVVGDFDTDTKYYQMTQSEADTGTSVTGRLISAKVLHNAILNAGGAVTVDDELSTTSTNPVQNKVITGELNDVKTDLSELSSSIAPVESSATATAAHAVGELFMMGETLLVALSAIAVGDTITTEGGSPNAAVTKLSDKLIKDVQINGSSILNNGVADIPLANSNRSGVVCVTDTFGLQMNTGEFAQYIMTVPAEVANIKNGNQGAEPNQRRYRPITPLRQHYSVFYGMAKAAGDTTQSESSNPVGTYTDAAKIAIQKMLGIYEAPWELIREDTFTNSTANPYIINVDSNGQPFELTDIKFIIFTPAQDTQAVVGQYGRVRLAFHAGSTVSEDILYIGAYTQAVGSTAQCSTLSLEQRNGLIEKKMQKHAPNNNEQTIVANCAYLLMASNAQWNLTSEQRIYTQIQIDEITGTGQYILYGRRKWQ